MANKNGVYWEYWRAANKRWYFHAKAANHEILCDSNQGHTNKKDCLGSIDLLKHEGAEVKNISRKNKEEKN